MGSAANRSTPLLGSPLPSPWAAPLGLAVAQYFSGGTGEEKIMLGGNNRAAIGGGDAIAAVRRVNPRVTDHRRTRISIGS
jgi:hypothetical protein